MRGKIEIDGGEKILRGAVVAWAQYKQSLALSVGARARG